MKWWLIGYIAGAVGMMLFVMWTALDYPLPRQRWIVIEVLLAIVFWPITAVLIIIQFGRVIGAAILFEDSPATDVAPDKYTTAVGKECSHCGASLPQIAQYCHRCGRSVSADEPAQ